MTHDSFSGPQPASIVEPLTQAQASVKTKAPAYERWVQSVGIPIHRGYFIEDLRTIELGWWSGRECNAAFIQLSGQEGVSENRITEIAPGQTLPPLSLAWDEAVYVIDGQGLTTVTMGEGDPPRTFEWGKYSMFVLPRHCTFQLTNASGLTPARLLHYNYLPLITVLGPAPEICLANDDRSFREYAVVDAGRDLFAHARQDDSAGPPGRRNVWSGNFFPNLLVWDELVGGRAGGGKTVTMHFQDSPIRTHMSVFPVGTYWQAHRHGPGVSIVIPKGHGYTILWREGAEKMVVQWHEASLFVPPDRWFHQHFNISSTETRYLAFHLPVSMSTGWRNLPGDQIPFCEEDPFVRRLFEDELRKRGASSSMPEQAYVDPNFKWGSEVD